MKGFLKKNQLLLERQRGIEKGGDSK